MQKVTGCVVESRALQVVQGESLKPHRNVLLSRNTWKSFMVPYKKQVVWTLPASVASASRKTRTNDWQTCLLSRFQMCYRYKKVLENKMVLFDPICVSYHLVSVATSLRGSSSFILTAVSDRDFFCTICQRTFKCFHGDDWMYNCWLR